MLRFILPRPILMAAVALFAVAAPATAAIRYDVVIDGPTAGTSSTATGQGVLILNDELTAVSFEITYSGLEGPETGAHFHYGGPGAIGPKVLTLPSGTPKIGVWAITPENVALLLAGEIYVNIHSEFYVAGEIRGNVTQGQVAVDAATWGAVKSLYR
jgi:hypothetical protein